MEYIVIIYLSILVLEFFLVVLSLGGQALFGESWDGTVPGTGMKFGWKFLLILLSIPALVILLIQYAILPLTN